MQLKTGSFNGEKSEDVKGMQKDAEVLPASLVPSAFLVHWLASASTGKKCLLHEQCFSVGDQRDF